MGALQRLRPDGGAGVGCPGWPEGCSSLQDPALQQRRQQGCAAVAGNRTPLKPTVMKDRTSTAHPADAIQPGFIKGEMDVML